MKGTSDKKSTSMIIPGPLFIVMAGILWGIIGLFSHPLSDKGFSALQITELRCIVVTLFLSSIIVIKDRSLFRVTLRDFKVFLCSGVFSITLFNICYFSCIQQSTLSVAVTLLYTGPCFVMIISSIVFREKFTFRKFVVLIMAVAGCAFITGLAGGGAQITISAFVVGLGAGLGYGLYSIFGKIALTNNHPLTVIFYTFLVAGIAIFPFCSPSEMCEIALSSDATMVIIILLGLCSTLAPFLCYTKGLENMEAGKAAMFAFVEPVVATLISIFVFREAFSINHAIGMAAIIGAITLLNLTKKKS